MRGFAQRGFPTSTFDRCLPGTTLAAALAAAPGARAASPEKLRIGFQKSSTLTIWRKSRGVLEKALAPLNVAVSWRWPPSVANAPAALHRRPR